MEKNIFLKITLLFGLLLGSIYSFGNPIVTRNAITLTPLPIMKITEVSSESYTSSIAKAIVDEKPFVHPAVGMQFDLPQMENQVLDYLNTSHTLNEAPLMVPPGTFGGWMAEIGQGNYSAKAKKAKEIVDKAIEIGRYIDVLTGGNLESMPIIKTQTIGSTDISLIFNSAKIYPEFAEIEVYVKIEMNGRKDFEGNPVVLYFGAKDIFFSQEKGLISGSVGLLADYSIQIGDNPNPQAGFWLKKMVATLTDDKGTPTPLDDDYDYEGTFINFDCEGFKEMGLGGRVLLSRDWVIPTDEFGVPLTAPNGSPGNTPRVNAEIDIIAQDFNDIMLTVDIEDPFVITKWQDMSFALKNATLDMSSYRTPAALADVYNITEPEWEGLYIENIAITMPEPFKRSCSSFSEAQQTGSPPPPGSTQQNNPNYEPPQTCRMQVAANHLLIDGYGVSGEFLLKGQAPLIGGAVMDGEWGWSLDSVGVVLYQSDVTGFLFGGEIGAPILSKQSPLGYYAYFDFGVTNKYKFEVNIPEDKPIKIPVWNAAQVIIENPSLQVEIEAGEFSAGVTFQTTTVQIGNPADYTTSNTGSMVKMPGLTIHELSLNTKAPHLSVGGIEINSGNSKVSNFPVTVNGLSLATNPNDEDELLLGFTIGLNLMDSSSNGVQASGDLTIKGEYVRDIDGTRSWKYKDLIFGGAEITACFPQFYGNGTLKILRDDPVYGNGFNATLDVKILGSNLCDGGDGKFELSMAAIFGSTDGYRYFLVDGFVGGEIIKVPIGGPFYLNGFGGGVFHHMRPSGLVPEGEANTPTPPGVDLSGIQYKPSVGTKLGIKFSTSITTVGGVMDGLLTAIIRFDQNMALQNITFWGTADIMLKSKLGENLLQAASKVQDAIDKVPMPLSQIKALNKDEAEDNDGESDEPGELSSGIKAKVGISLDFTNSLVFHAFADVNINIGGDLLTGRGTLDLLVGGGNWHFYLGGYYENDQGQDIMVPDFFDESKFIRLAPVSAELSYGGFSVRANMYFLTGNTIPGPPPPAPEVVDFFGNEADGDNRGLLNCGGSDPAMGTGVAFGASAFFDFEKVSKGLFGSCLGGFKVDVGGGVGFDLALLKYPTESVCGTSGDSPHGLNNFRATGRVFAFINIEGGHATCIPMPPLGFGIKIKFDVPNPSYFDIVGVIKVGKKWRVGLSLGSECGTPCSNSVNVN